MPGLGKSFGTDFKKALGFPVAFTATAWLPIYKTWSQRLGFCRHDSCFLLVFVPDNTVPVILEAYEIRCLFEELDSPDPDLLVKTTIKIAKVTGPKRTRWGPSSWAPAHLPAPLPSLLLSRKALASK